MHVSSTDASMADTERFVLRRWKKILLLLWQQMEEEEQDL